MKTMHSKIALLSMLSFVSLNQHQTKAIDSLIMIVGTGGAIVVGTATAATLYYVQQQCQELNKYKDMLNKRELELKKLQDSTNHEIEQKIKEIAIIKEEYSDVLKDLTQGSLNKERFASHIEND